MRWHQLILIVAPAFACLVDASLTLYGQSADYWSGDTTSVNELSPEPRRLLAISPWLFAVVVLGWIAANGFLVVCTRRPMATIFASVITLAHVSGAATWILWSSQYGYQLATSLQLVSGTILAITINHVYGKPDTVAPYLLFPAGAYKATVCVLVVAMVFLFLVPH